MLVPAASSLKPMRLERRSRLEELQSRTVRRGPNGRSCVEVLASLQDLTAARAGHRDGSFIRIWRIFRITRIAQRGVTSPLAGPGFLGTAARDATGTDRSHAPKHTEQKVHGPPPGPVTPLGAIRLIRKIRQIRMKLPSRELARGSSVLGLTHRAKLAILLGLR